MTFEKWQPVRLGELIKIKHGWPFEREFFSEELTGLPIVVTIGNFQYTGGFRFETTALKEYRGFFPNEYILDPGDILLIMTCQTEGGEILGIPGRIPANRIYLHNQRMGKVVILQPDIVDKDYLYWLFLGQKFNQALVATASGTKILHTAPSRIEAFEFLLPPLPEQRAIAAILGALDDKIELNRATNATLEEIARTLFTSWFVEFAPVRAKAAGHAPHGMDAATAALFPDSLEDSPLGLVPEGWRVESLDRIATYLNGLALQKFPAEDDEYLPVIKIAQLRKGNTEGSDRASTTIPAAYIVDDGDVLFSWSGSLEVVLWCGGRGALNQHLFKVTSQEYPKWFYYFWTKHHLGEFQAIASGKATTMGHIQRHHLSAAHVFIPSPELLQYADEVIASMLDKLIALNIQMRQLKETRDTLLPKLLSSALRVKDIEASL